MTVALGAGQNSSMQLILTDLPITVYTKDMLQPFTHCVQHKQPAAVMSPQRRTFRTEGSYLARLYRLQDTGRDPV